MKLPKVCQGIVGRMHLCAVLGLHMEDLVADALPDIPLPAAPHSHHGQAQRVAQAPPLVQQPRQPARQPVLSGRRLHQLHPALGPYVFPFTQQGLAHSRYNGTDGLQLVVSVLWA